MTAEAVRAYYGTLIPDNPKAESHTRTQKIRETMERLFVEGKGNRMDGVRGSWWAAYNGASEFVDHARSNRGADDGAKALSRTASILFGSGAQIKRKAFSLALELSQG